MAVIFGGLAHRSTVADNVFLRLREAFAVHALALGTGPFVYGVGLTSDGLSVVSASGTRQFTNVFSISEGNDRTEDGAGTDVLIGCAGADTLSVDAGADALRGSIGRDTIRGCAVDDFVHSAVNERVPGSGQDRLLGFVILENDIVLSAMYGNQSVSGNQAFVLDRDSNFSAGEIRQTLSSAGLLLELDVDTDAALDTADLLDGATAKPLASDIDL